jgi:porin
MERTTLTGDWFGTRTALRDKGITWDISSTNFYNGVTTGGVQDQFRYGGRADYLFHLDGQKLGLWQGFFVDLHGETLYGVSVNGAAGTLLPVTLAQSLPVAQGPVTALTGVKFTQALSEHFVVFGGKLNILDGFNQPFTGGARGTDGFMNTAMVFPPIFAGPVPYSTFGAGFAVLKDLQPVFTFMALDPNNTPTVSGFNTFFDNGVTLLAELNVPLKLFGLPGHQGVLGTWSSGRFNDFSPTVYFNPLQGIVIQNNKQTNPWVVAYAFDQALYVAPDDAKRSWGVFGNLGIADQTPSPARWFANIGLGGSSPFPGRKLDSFGVGYFYLGVNQSLKDLAPRLLPLGDEQGVEVFYNVGVTPWCHITPDIQVVVPSRERVPTPLVFGLRAKLDF